MVYNIHYDNRVFQFKQNIFKGVAEFPDLIHLFLRLIPLTVRQHCKEISHLCPNMRIK